jgi:hypothetical protein
VYQRPGVATLIPEVTGGHFDHGDGADSDPRLTHALRRALALADPVPPLVLAGAQAIWSWRTIDAELAELAYDSALDHAGPALVRSGDGERTLTFESADDPSLAIEVGVLPLETCRVVGQIVPPQPARGTIRHAGGETELVVDELGRFVVDDVPRGLVRFVFTLGEGAAARTIATEARAL